MANLFAEITVFNALDKTLHYRIPPELCSEVKTGKRVIVPLGRRESLGLILRVDELPPRLEKNITLRPILAVVDSNPVVPLELLKLCQWVSEYYFYPLGEVLKTALPSGIQSTSSSHFRLTDKGKHAAQSDDASDLLRLLSRESQLGLSKLIEGSTVAFRAARKELRRHEQTGLVERCFEWHPPQLSPKMIRTVRLIDSKNSEELGNNPNLVLLVDLLKHSEGKPVALKDLRKRTKNLDYWLKKLSAKGLVAIDDVEELRESNFAQILPQSPPFHLTREQEWVFEEVSPHIKHSSFQPFLLHGVTGSGKTEIYIRLIEAALKLKKGALVLVPEIALSTQLEALFRQRFGTLLAVWHSALGGGARYDQWREILAGNRKIILGARSAVFMPVENLGLIIVDEEHDSSYKQEDRLRYHARDVALVRSRMLGIPIVLGSATPSLQSYYHAQKGRYKGLHLSKRILERPLPELNVVDMRRQGTQSGILSAPLQQALTETVEQGEQALIFLNRRGFATFLLCHLCGHVLQCSHCSVSLTYHQKEGHLRCHYCGWVRTIPQECPVCANANLIFRGFGTERVEEEIRKLLPTAGIVRIDRDTITRPEHLVKSLNAVRNRCVDVLIGTQMVAKGHDFPNITLVGIINADTALQIADFRAGESTVQILMQVAGRTGRGEKLGRVILQTYNPGHYTIEAVIQMEYGLFCAKELASREELQYPPFTRMAKFLVTAPLEDATKNAAAELAFLCRKVAQEFRLLERPVAILGPTPAPLTKLNRRFRWQLFVKAWTNQNLQDFIAKVLERTKTAKQFGRAQLNIDRDPMSTL